MRDAFPRQMPSSLAFVTPPRKHPRPRWAMVGVAALVLVSLVAAPEERPPEERAKGNGAALRIFVKHADSVRRAGPGDTVEPGDVLLLAVSSPASRHVAVFGYDGTGEQLYLADSLRAIAVPAGEDVPLPVSIRLDDAPQDEHVVAYFCASPVSVETLRNALRTQVDAPEGCSVDRHTLRKRRGTH